MKPTITQRELRNDSAAVLRRVQAGETLAITRHGVPIAELTPTPPGRFVTRALIVEAAATAPTIDFERFRKDVDAVVDQSVDA